MSQDKLRVGVIGAGGIARSVHLPSLNDLPDVEIAAICDLVEKRAAEQAERYSIPRIYTVYHEMLAREELDAAYVLVEPANLFHVAVNCLEAGLPVFMEKPPGVTSFQAEGLLRASERTGKILQVGFNRRHIPLVRQVVDTMRSLTTITQVEGRFMKCGTAAFDKGGLSAFDSDSIHAIDLVRWMADGTAVKAATVRNQVEDIVPNMWNSVARFDNGVTGIVKANYQTGGRTHTFEIHGPGASAFINLGMGGAQCEAQIMTTEGKGGYSLAATGTGGHGLQTLDGKELAGSDQFHRYYGFYHEDMHFLECVRRGAQPETSIADAVKTFRFVDLLNASLI
ncbi:MAG: Gfo/Idh/MocA family oxidoreductase [Candidatus Brocadiaceae bacterium]|nr:Gfo/Idh/MocA family oxidoreductase [Candidatus Brocadiaceae bacterium]